MISTTNPTQPEQPQHPLEGPYLKLIARLSARMIHLNLSSDYLIDESLADLGRQTAASRAYVFLFRCQYTYMDNLYEWCAPGVSAEKMNLQNLKTDGFPWWMAQLHQNQIITVPRTDEMPKEAHSEQQMVLAQGIKSLVVLPLHIKDELIGYLGLDDTTQYRHWDDSSLFSLRLIADIFSGAFARLRCEKDYLNANEALDRKDQNIRQLLNRIQTDGGSLKPVSSLDLSVPAGLHKESLNELIQQVISLLQTDLAIFDEVDLALDSHLPLMDCNRFDLCQVIQVIIKNAIDEAVQKNAVLAGRGARDTNLLKVETLKEGNHLICHISDNGMGVPECNQMKIFEPLFSTKPLHSGSGLGLSFAYDVIVNKYQGDISISTNHWGGATFTLRLPFRQEKIK
ncbi:GAF domain-containing sensor histidine kinase [Anoxynatronum buryatiense]|uniref:histidine kinase n=1 Tax=Anoxynatronum buryatiense TaxID=489973 RepID=A0AA45WVA8_9CLOT|nr:GAF domain-containing sensor histidine kinase [Anoxynatronum buryatiense]SMP51968.1 GAF domain-containing protein [Anoxynatronum buryatiense]